MIRSLSAAPGGTPCRIRPIATDDLPGVLAVQRSAYGDAYQESAAVLGAKLSLAAGASWLAEAGDGVLGYVFAHGWVATPPPLHVALDAVPAGERVGFLHDLAVLPQGRGGGVAARLFERVVAWAQAEGLTRLTLVALADAQAYWRRKGFVPLAPADGAVLPAAYGKGAIFMAFDLAAADSPLAACVSNADLA